MNIQMSPSLGESKVQQPLGLPKEQMQMQQIEEPSSNLEEQKYQEQIIIEPYNQQMQFGDDGNQYYQEQSGNFQQAQYIQENELQHSGIEPNKFQSQIYSQQLIFNAEKQSLGEGSQLQQKFNNNSSQLVHSSLQNFCLDVDELRDEIFQQKIQKYYTNLLESSLKKLQILITTHPELEDECDFVYHKGSSISYFARQNLSNKGFFNQYGNYSAFEKPLKVITMTANVLFDKLNKLCQKNRLDERLQFSIEKQVLTNIEQSVQEIISDPSKVAIRKKMEEENITNEMAFLFIAMYHSEGQAIETTTLLQTFEEFVQKIELRSISNEEMKKIKLLISDKKKYQVSLKQINDFFNGFWTSPTDFEYLEIPKLIPNKEEWPQTKLTLTLEKVAPRYNHLKSKVWKSEYIDVGQGDSIELLPEKDPIVFGRMSSANNKSVVGGLKFFLFHQEQKLISRHQFAFKYTEDKKFKLKCISSGNPTCFKVQQNQQYILHEEMLFFLGSSQGFVVKQLYNGKKDYFKEQQQLLTANNNQIVDIFLIRKPELSLLEKRANQSVNSNKNNLILAQQLQEKQKVGDVIAATKLQQQLFEEEKKQQFGEEEHLQNVNPNDGPFIEIEGLAEAEEQFKTDFGWQNKVFYSKEMGCILLGSSAECALRFTNEEIKPRHSEILFNEEIKAWVLTAPYEDAETFISLKTLSQIKNEEDTREFEVKEGLVIAIEQNEFKIRKIEKDQPNL